MQDTIEFMVGAARVLAASSTFGWFKPAEFISLTDDQHSPYIDAELGRSCICPIYCVHVTLPGMSLLVDASADVMKPGAPDTPVGVNQPPGVIARLAEAGILPADITHLVITHGHEDHVSGLTVVQDGKLVPQFPNARHYFGAAEWNDPHFQKVFADKQSSLATTLGVVHDAGLLTLVIGDLELGHGVTILAAPGETPGHQVVRVNSNRETLYCLGDLYHFEFEFSHPHIFAKWKLPEAVFATRTMMTKRVIDDHASMIVTHIPGLGQLDSTDNGVCWRSINTTRIL